MGTDDFDDFQLSPHDAQVFSGIVAGAELAAPSEQLVSADRMIDRHEIEVMAHELIANRNRIETTYKSPKTYQDDARTLLFEALTASGHLSTIETSGTLDQIHHMMISVLLNAYSESLPAHEQRRRFMEICEELTLQALERKIVAGEVSESVQLATISDYIVEGTMSEKSAELIGYRAGNKKGMVRTNRLRSNDDGTVTRISQQLSRSNSSAEQSRAFLMEQGVTVRASAYADVSVLGTQLLHDMAEGVIGLQRRLDHHQGPGIRYGEIINDQQSTYESLEAESTKRERVAQCYVDQLADFTRQLDRQLQSGCINEKQYQAQFKHEVAAILRAICVMDPSYAVGCFGEASQSGFVRASDLTAAGDYAGAAAVVEANQSLEQTVSFCGMSIAAEEAQKLGIEVDPITKLLKIGVEKWKSRQGACRIENCPSPKQTEIGPCSVCMNGCQKLFDRKWSYQRIKTFYAQLKKSNQRVIGKTTEKTGSFKKQHQSIAVSGVKKAVLKEYTPTQKHEKMNA